MSGEVWMYFVYKHRFPPSEHLAHRSRFQPRPYLAEQPFKVVSLMYSQNEEG